jgi:uncharacterized protein YjbI with pentapeptide repeats
MTKFDVLNRWTGEVQFTAKISCCGNEPESVQLGLAIKWAIKAEANLRWADLRWAKLSGADLRWAKLSGADLRWANLNEADLRGVDLRWANLRWADLRWANLNEADLSWAKLSGADLSWVNLSWVNLSGANLIHCGTRSDGYAFFAQIKDGKIWIKAGCRYFTIEDAKKHWNETRPDCQLGEESRQLLKNANALVKIRGLK